jgi:hypothetical protein
MAARLSVTMGMLGAHRPLARKPERPLGVALAINALSEAFS